MAHEEAPVELTTIKSSSDFYQHMSSFYLDEDFSDVTFTVNGEKISAHRVILAAKSQVLKTMFSKKTKQSDFTISKTSVEAFQMMLKYIYTGTIAVASSKASLIFEIIRLANKYSLLDLETQLTIKMTSTLDVSNVFAILNQANLHKMSEVTNICYAFVDDRINEILKTNSINVLTQNCMIDLLRRKSFTIPEVEKFNLVKKWCQINEDVDKSVLKCIHLSRLTSAEILNIVWPSKLVDETELLAALAEITNKNEKKAENASECEVQEVEYEVNFISKENQMVIDLHQPCSFNHIKMKLPDDIGFYRYYVQNSLDGKIWSTLIDYRNYDCRSQQILYFEEKRSRYVRVIPTCSWDNSDFLIEDCKVYLAASVPKTLHQIIYPTHNVATAEMGACVIEGKRPNLLLNGDVSRNSYSTYHEINKGHITVQLAQPCMISTIKLLLPSNENYRYFIKTSTDRKLWELVVNRVSEDCNDWQIHHFDERPVVYIRITGVFCNKESIYFDCRHFECMFVEKKDRL